MGFEHDNSDEKLAMGFEHDNSDEELAMGFERVNSDEKLVSNGMWRSCQQWDLNVVIVMRS